MTSLLFLILSTLMIARRQSQFIKNIQRSKINDGEILYSILK